MRRSLLAAVLVVVAACGPQPGVDEDGGITDVDSGSAGGAGGGGGTGGGAGGGGGATIRRITSISLTPPTLALNVGQISGVTALATFDDGSTGDVSGTVQWLTSTAGVVDVSIIDADDNLVKVQALAAGTVAITAKTGSVTSDTCQVTVTQVAADAGTPAGGPKEVRALWITRFAYNTQAQVQTIINDAAAGGFNVIYFQIRGNGDAYYQSSLVPWASKLTGTLGQDPGWDPLQTAITAAHARGMQLHAYFNVFSGWPTPSGCSSTTCACTPPDAGVTDPCSIPPVSPSGKPTHILRQHPEWMAVTSNGKSIDSEYYWISPAALGYRQHVVAVVDELLTNYDVDGLHLDRIRYPGSTYSYDAESNAAYNALASPKPTRADWQRTLVNDMVNAIYGKMKQKKPRAVLSASVWGIYKVLTGCSTSQGFANYYQDSIGWMKQGYIDALTPMIYWDIGTGCTDWSKHLDVFMAGANGRHIVAGMHALDNNPNGGADLVRPDRIKARVQYARQVGAAGTSVFASSYLTPTHYATFRGDGGVYAVDAGWPAITWRDAGQ